MVQSKCVEKALKNKKNLLILRNYPIYNIIK